MSKISLENKKGKITITNRLSYPETVNTRIYNAIASGMFEGFLPVSIQQKRKETRIECVVQGLTPLTQYFGGIVTKKMFLDFVHEIALQIKECEKNMFSANNLELQSNMIFIDPRTKSVKCIFWPVVNNQRENPPHLFLKQLPFSLKFNPYDNNDFLATYNSFFSGIKPFSVNNFDKMILKFLGKDTSNGILSPSESLSNSLKDTTKATTTNKKLNIEYDPLDVKSRHTDDKKFERDFFNKTTNLNINLSRSIEIKSGHGGQNTPQTIIPTLIRLKTNKAYLVDKPAFKIGKGQSGTDLFIDGNNFISRIHAYIITRNNKFYIVDNDSTNKTFVNGAPITAKKEIEIFNGTRIRLANEEFIFKIKQ